MDVGCRIVDVDLDVNVDTRVGMGVCHTPILYGSICARVWMKLRACVDVIARVCGCMGVDACAYESGGVDACVRMCVCLNLHLLPWTRVGPWPSRVRPPRRRWSFRI